MSGHDATGFAVVDDPTAAALAANESPVRPGPAVMHAVAAAADALHRYPDPAARELRELIAQRFGVGVEHVLAGNGGSELLTAMGRAWLRPGARFVFPWPSYYAYPALAATAGATPCPVPLDDRLANDLQAIAAAGEGADMVCVCEPNNPTGGAHGPAELARLLEACPAGVPVVVDEAYWEFNTLVDQCDVNALLAAFPDVVLLRTLSKAHRLAGARVGYAVFGDAALAAEVDATRSSFPVSGLAQAAAVAALRDEAGLACHVEATRAVRERMRAGLAGLGLAVAPSEANFVWVEPPAGVDDRALADALARTGVHVAVGSDLCGARGLRITAGTASDGSRVVNAMERALQEVRVG